MDVVVFGAGLNATRSINFLKQKFNILWYVDNNKEKIGRYIGEYEIKAIDSLKCYDGNVIIIAENHTYEIMNQLEQIGINKNKVFSLLCTHSGDGYSMDVYPINKIEYHDDGKPLLSYDFLKRNEKYNKRKVLIFAKFYSVYTKQLVENLYKRYNDIELSILTGAKETKDMIDNKSIAHIYYFESMHELIDILHKLPQYDVAQLLWIEEIWAYCTEEIRQKFYKLNLFVGGSDFYRASKYDLEFKRKIISVADHISIETPQVCDEFVEYYNIDRNKIKIIPYGLEVINWINENHESKDSIKTKFNIPDDKLIVTCGHNANQAHQHLKLIESLKELSQNVKDKVIFVFPMTYPSGREEYIKSVKDRLEKCNLSYRIITNFMDFKLMAQYDIISDIMIHVQTTDTLSSTMLEEMYTGSVIIAGSWLPYKSLHERKLYFLDADTINDAVYKLEYVVQNIEEYRKKCMSNKEIIWKYHSWDNLISQWHDIFY